MCFIIKIAEKCYGRKRWINFDFTQIFLCFPFLTKRVRKLYSRNPFINWKPLKFFINPQDTTTVNIIRTLPFKCKIKFSIKKIIKFKMFLNIKERSSSLLQNYKLERMIKMNAMMLCSPLCKNKDHSFFAVHLVPRQTLFLRKFNNLLRTWRINCDWIICTSRDICCLVCVSWRWLDIHHEINTFHWASAVVRCNWYWRCFVTHHSNIMDTCWKRQRRLLRNSQNAFAQIIYLNVFNYLV